MLTANNYLIAFPLLTLWGSIVFWIAAGVCYMAYVYWITIIWLGRTILPQSFKWYRGSTAQLLLRVLKQIFLKAVIPLVFVIAVVMICKSTRRIGALSEGLFKAVHDVGAGPIFGIKQMPALIALANYVFVYGTFHLAIVLGLKRMSHWIDMHPRWRWLRRLSAFDGWSEFLKKHGRGRLEAGFFMLLRYLGSWILGLVIASPIALLIPGFWDPVIAVPETIMILLAGLAWLPILITVVCIRYFLIPEIKETMFPEGTKAEFVRFYRLVIVPVVCVFACAALFLSSPNKPKDARSGNVEMVEKERGAESLEMSHGWFSCPRCGHVHWLWSKFVEDTVKVVVGIICLVFSWGSLICFIGGPRGAVAAVTCWIICVLCILLRDVVEDCVRVVSFCGG